MWLNLSNSLNIIITHNFTWPIHKKNFFAWHGRSDVESIMIIALKSLHRGVLNLSVILGFTSNSIYIFLYIYIYYIFIYFNFLKKCWLFFLVESTMDTSQTNLHIHWSDSEGREVKQREQQSSSKVGVWNHFYLLRNKKRSWSLIFEFPELSSKWTMNFCIIQLGGKG